ncbi:MAG: hypothetical protein A3C36_05505 [Omnitrophica WOR_2 bacterium RIFCSPHIGHO2_02_FULL_52_10]|nr:MAG: hypothetical protein A3C36_05505 [Omnitrophica WOR_2 bacterium RIFCSPHIGHO2_02_FULL_52_10]
MNVKHRWVWEVYCVLMLAFAVKNIYNVFSPDSESFLYYFILRSFDPVFYFHYSAHVLQVLLNAVHCLPLFFFTYRVRCGVPAVWKTLFVLRCVFEVIGHAYGMNSLVALYHSKSKFLLLVIVAMTVPHIPSYAACFWYAFRGSVLKLDGRR